jgi:hypothetical protein
MVVGLHDDDIVYIQMKSNKGVGIMETEMQKSTRKKTNSIFVELTGRPERDTVINEEDIANLKIALETARTLEEFLALV